MLLQLIPSYALDFSFRKENDDAVVVEEDPNTILSFSFNARRRMMQLTIKGKN